MKLVTIGTITWLAIYLGLVLVALGLSLRPSDAAFGWTLAGTGIVLVVIGMLLIWVRSRMKRVA